MFFGGGGDIKKILCLGMLLCLSLLLFPQTVSYASESDVVKEQGDQFDDLIAQIKGEGLGSEVGGVDDVVKSGAGALFSALLRYIPIVGYIGFLVGLLFFVFSRKNKGARRWGVRIMILLPVLMFAMYLVVAIMYDRLLAKAGVVVSVTERQDFLRNVYVSVAANRAPLFRITGLETVKNLVSDAVLNIVDMYKATAFDFILVSIMMGIIVTMVSKRYKEVRLWAMVCLCCVLPAVFGVCYWAALRV